MKADGDDDRTMKVIAIVFLVVGGLAVLALGLTGLGQMVLARFR